MAVSLTYREDYVDVLDQIIHEVPQYELQRHFAPVYDFGWDLNSSNSSSFTIDRKKIFYSGLFFFFIFNFWLFGWIFCLFSFILFSYYILIYSILFLLHSHLFYSLLITFSFILFSSLSFFEKQELTKLWQLFQEQSLTKIVSWMFLIIAIVKATSPLLLSALLTQIILGIVIKGFFFLFFLFYL